MEDADNFLLTQPDSPRPVRVVCFPEGRHVEVNVVMHVQRSVMPGGGQLCAENGKPGSVSSERFFPLPISSSLPQNASSELEAGFQPGSV